MGKKGSWFSAIKRVFIPSSKEKPVNGSEKKSSKEKKKGRGILRHGETKSFIPLFREPSSIEKILGEVDQQNILIGPSTPAEEPKPAPLVVPRAASPRVASPKVVSPRATSQRVTSPRASVQRVTSPRAASPRVASPKAASSRAVVQHHHKEVSYRPEPTLRFHHISATKIQAAYRGYMARRSFRALKGLVRLQGVVRGQNVKRQTVNAMKMMQLLVRVQTQIQSRRIQMLENQAIQRQSYKNDKELESNFGKWTASQSEAGHQGDWDDSLLTKEEREARLQKKVEAIFKRERSMAYAYSHQLWKANPKSAQTSQTDIRSGGYPWWWNWLERQLPPPTNPPETQSIKSLHPSPLRPTLEPKPSPRPARRHSSAESWGPNEAARRKPKTSVDLVMAEAKKPGLRPVTVSYTQMNVPKIKSPGGRVYLPGVEDDPEEEIMKLLDDEDTLDEEIINGLIKSLKIPLPSLQNPPSQKEILFPARIISLLAKQMWKFGFIKESERLFANVMKTIQEHVMDFEGDEAILPGAYWLSNVHELLSFANAAERDMLRGVNPAAESGGKAFEWHDYERLVSIVKHDLESLEYNIYHTWMKELKKRLFKMVIPAVIESQSLPGFITNENNRFLTKFITGPTTPAFSMDDLLNFLNKVWKAMKSYYVEMSVIQQVVTELLKLIGVTSFNDLLMRRNFCSWKRAMQIQYNITRIEEWCKSHEMPEGTLQLEHLMQATKLLQLKKATLGDIEIIYDVCWMLTPTQIQKLISHYFVADYENPISPEILKAVASRVVANDKTDILMLDATPLEDSGPFEVPSPRDVAPPDNYLPAWLNLPHVKRLGTLAT